MGKGGVGYYDNGQLGKGNSLLLTNGAMDDILCCNQYFTPPTRSYFLEIGRS